jgi:hypothetical protein
MFAGFRVFALAALVVALLPSRLSAQTLPAGASTAVILHAAEATKLLPASVFFSGQSAPVQARNSGGIKFGDGMLTLAALIDTSGYSSAVQQKYQTYLITEGAILINGHLLPPGAYGAGFVTGHFGVMDIGGHDMFSVDATHDAELKRPTPLQFIVGGSTGEFRLYQGRDYVVITAPHQ